MQLLAEESSYSCSVCKKWFKTKRGLMRHNTIVRGYNQNPPGTYKLPLKASVELKKILVKHIQDRLKEHFTYSGLQRVLIPCTLSQFYSIFKGYIHRRFSKSGRVRCLFQGENAYSLIGQILNDIQWGTKHFINNQRTYVTFRPPRERAPRSKQKEVKPRITQVIVDWYQKAKTDTHEHITWSGYISFRFFVARGHF
ncbi:12237_t:CDS:2 [Cetraspora pellucida]|uniref:12237_t:CDS:1 n=1 Tax=Cetraspora pellucida TaxID=1433469 RepID=A0A9N8VLS1_9GLOM|nr:12237_t:CDS:2 [Cetraspora pellucida]